MATFAVMTSSLFGLGLGVAQAREQPWEGYTRSLPAPAISRILAQIVSTGLIGLIAVIPLLVIGVLFTEARFSALQLVGLYIALVFGAFPFMTLGVCVGYALPAKAAIAAVQILMFGLAFGGGLFLPPELFPGWLNDLSLVLPSRQVRELTLWAGQGNELNPWMLVGVIAWSAAGLAGAVLLARRDLSRRYA